MSFIIVSGKVILFLPNVSSLKEKRQIVKSVKTRLRNKFNITVSEIDDNDLWQKATLGIAHATNERRNGQSYLDRVINFLSSEPEAKVIDYKIETY